MRSDLPALDIKQLVGTSQTDLERNGIIQEGKLNIAAIRDKINLFDKMVLREGDKNTPAARASIVAARLGMTEDVLTITRQGQNDKFVWEALRRADFETVRAWQAREKEAAVGEFITRVLVLFNRYPWGMVRPSDGMPSEEYSRDKWLEMMRFIEENMPVFEKMDLRLIKTLPPNINSFKAALKLLDLKLKDPKIFNLTNSVIKQAAGDAPGKVDLILRKIKEYSLLPKKKRLTTPRLIKIALLNEPEERFKFIDKIVEDGVVDSLSQIGIIISKENYKQFYNEVLENKEKAEKLGLEISPYSIVRMLKAGITMEDVKREAKQAKKLGLEISTSSVVTMLQAGITLEDVSRYSTETGVPAMQAILFIKTGVGTEELKRFRGKTKVSPFKAYLIYSQIRTGLRSQAIEAIYSFLDKYNKLKEEKAETIAKQEMPGYLTDLILLMSCLEKSSNEAFARIYQETFSKIYLDNTRPETIFYQQLFPEYLQKAEEVLRAVKLIYSRRCFRLSGTDVYAVIRLEDKIAEKREFAEIIKDTRVPDPFELAIASLQIERIRKVIADKEYHELIEWFSVERKKEETPTSIEVIIKKIREALPEEYLEEEEPEF